MNTAEVSMSQKRHLVGTTGKSRLAALVVYGLLGCAPSAWADAVTDWNEITVNAVTVGRPGPVGVLDLALVQAAVHDAVQAIDRRFEPYYVEVPGRFADTAARKQGQRVAEWVFDHYLRPLDDDHHGAHGQSAVPADHDFNHQEN